MHLTPRRYGNVLFSRPYLAVFARCKAATLLAKLPGNLGSGQLAFKFDVFLSLVFPASILHLPVNEFSRHLTHATIAVARVEHKWSSWTLGWDASDRWSVGRRSGDLYATQGANRLEGYKYQYLLLRACRFTARSCGKISGCVPTQSTSCSEHGELKCVI